MTAARKEAATDPLTGLLSRAGFNAAVEQALAELGDTENSVCVLLLDIDRFERINDSYGHLFGDRVLRLVAEVVRKCIKGKDAAGRFGGEEFAVLLPDTRMVGAPAVA